MEQPGECLTRNPPDPGLAEPSHMSQLRTGAVQLYSQSRSLRPVLRMKIVTGCGWQRGPVHFFQSARWDIACQDEKPPLWRGTSTAGNLALRLARFAVTHRCPEVFPATGNAKHCRWPQCSSIPNALKDVLVHPYDKILTINEREVDLHLLTGNADLSPSENGQAQNHTYGLNPGVKTEKQRHIYDIQRNNISGRICEKLLKVVPSEAK